MMRQLTRTAANRLEYLFGSTKGLILLSISLISLVTAIWATLSGPMAEWGIKEITVRLLGMELHPAQREGRIIMLYHSIAMAVIAVEVYMITSVVGMKRHQQTTINGTITVGYLVALVFGLWFAYFGHNFVFHGLFLVGQSLVFFSGCLLAVALWPWRKEYYLPADSEYARTRKGVDLERVAFFVMTVAALGSACFGAVAGSYWGRGHETFLAEDLIRIPNKNALQLAIIGHLHIMLTLIAVALALIVGRWLDFKGIFHKIAMPLMIAGSIIITFGVWAVVPWQPIAHIIINFGAVFVMVAALLLVIFGWRKLIRERLAAQGIKGGFWPSLKALGHDPLKFGALWQMVFMNFTVSGVGIFMAINLDKIFRVWPAREERISLTGHWHILAAIIATIILMYYADICGLRGKARKWFGWILIIGSDIAFAAVTIFSMKRLFVSEHDQQPLMDWMAFLTDLGLGAIMVILALLLLWRLYDLFQPAGRWKEEFDDPELAMERILPVMPADDSGKEAAR